MTFTTRIMGQSRLRNKNVYLSIEFLQNHSLFHIGKVDFFKVELQKENSGIFFSKSTFFTG